ncbi:MAG: tetratricopeptide repeat protein, partial [Armatimonadota bacterium]|nr:tetratricopeptide repeat protein [Armatimonadota bacterium]
MRLSRCVVGRAILCLSCVLLVGLGSPCEAQAPTVPPDPAGQQQPPHQDAPAPEPHPDLKPLVEVIRTRLHKRKYEEALQQASALLQRATEKGDAVGQAYAQRFRARALQELNRLQEALLAWERAEQLWREIGDGALVVEAMLGQAFCVWRANEAGSRRLVEQALELARAEQRRPLTLARILGNAGADWYNARVLGFAQQCWEQALVIFERLTPGSPETADTLNNLGIVAGDQGNVALARRYFEQALALHKHLAPNSLEVANTLNNLGVVAHRWGDLNLAQRYFEQALAIKVRLVPNSLTVASTLNNLGGVAFYRG